MGVRRVGDVACSQGQGWWASGCSPSALGVACELEDEGGVVTQERLEAREVIFGEAVDIMPAIRGHEAACAIEPPVARALEGRPKVEASCARPWAAL